MKNYGYERIRVDPNRLHDNLAELAELASNDDKVNFRRTFSDDHQIIREWFRKKAIDADLEFRVDSVRNHSAFLGCGPSGAKTLFIGSHLDFDPLVGRYDESLGVLLALEVLRAVKEKELRLPFHLEAIDFTGPIGTQNIRLGSDTLAGKITPNSFDDIARFDPEFLKGLDLYDLDEDDIIQANRNIDRYAGFIGINIDRSHSMDCDQKMIGIVSQVAGKRNYRATFRGDDSFSAITTMKNRRDASIGASAFALSAHQLIAERFKDCTFNVSGMEFLPGESGSVPSRVDVFYEFRTSDSAVLDVETELIKLGKSEAAKYGLGYEFESLKKRNPVTMSAKLQEAIIQAVDSLGFIPKRTVSMVSFDGVALAEACPVGIILIPKNRLSDISNIRNKDWEYYSEVVNVLFQSICNFAFKISEINK